MDIQVLHPPAAALGGADAWLTQDAHPDLRRFARDARLEWKRLGVLFPRDDLSTAAFLRDLSRRVPVEGAADARYFDFEQEQDDELALHESEFAFAATMDRFKSRIDGGAAVVDRGGLAQRMVWARHLPAAVEWARGRDNIYLTQNTFKGWSRIADSCAGLTSLWVDLDYYAAGGRLAHLNDDRAAIDEILTVAGLLSPSQIVRSGRGLYVRWIFDHFLPAAAASRWRAAQAALLDGFKHLGADPKAQDASRVLRVVGSRNPKSGTPVRLIYSGRSIIFDDAASLLLGRQRLPQWERELVRAQTAALFERLRLSKGRARESRISDDGIFPVWGNGCIFDIEQLINLRKGQMDGLRETACFALLNFKMRMGEIGSIDEFEKALRRIAGKMHGAEHPVLLDKVLNLWDGKKKYHLSRAWIIKCLKVTNEELLQLPMIGLKARRAANIAPAARQVKCSREQLKDARATALELSKMGKTDREVAAELRRPRRTISKWLSHARAEQWLHFGCTGSNSP